MRFLNIKTDYAFKKVFGSQNSKNILKSFLNSTLELPSPMDDLTIVDPYNVPKLQGMKETAVDVKAVLEDKTKVIIEMQIINHDEFESRILYNTAKISSVAGDRGRKSNYIYGSPKAALTAYLSGLRNELCNAQVQVLTVKPRFVAAKMTEDMDLLEKLTAHIYKAQQRVKSVLYTKWMWRWVMLIIRNIPEWQFKKISI